MRSAKVPPRGCSLPLERAIVDFAADQAFAQTRIKLREHWGFMIGESTIQGIVLGHARNMFEASQTSPDFPEAPMAAKISMAHAKGTRTPVYAGAIEGGVEIAGRQLFERSVRAGFGADSRVHAVGDVAPWSVGQVEEQFGAQGSYLIDLYHHVCEYLSDAAKAIVSRAAPQEARMAAR